MNKKHQFVCNHTANASERASGNGGWFRMFVERFTVTTSLDESKPFRCLLAPSCADRAEWVILPFFYAAGAAFTSPEMKMMFAGLGRQVKR